MSKTDKKIISISLLFILIASMIMPTITLAATSDAVAIKDSVLKEYLVNNYDENGDGAISKGELEHLTNLYIPEGVKDLSGLEQATNLDDLSIEYELKDLDFTPVSKTVTSITVTCNGTEEVHNFELSFLKQFKNLKSLSLYGYADGEDINNQIDLSALKEIPSLETLYICDNFQSDLLSTLKDCTNLKDLQITSIDELNLNSISNLQNLETLYLSDLKLTNASEIAKLANLKEIGLQYLEGINDLSMLKTCSKLESIDLGDITTTDNTPIDMSVLSNNKQIKSIWLYNLNAKNINTFSKLEKLQDLYLTDITLASVEDYNYIKFIDYNAYLGEEGILIKSKFLNFETNIYDNFNFKSNSDAVIIDKDGLFKAEKLGEATITATAKNNPSIVKTFKVKVNGISAEQALGTKMGSTLVDTQTVLKANGDLFKVYASDEKAVKVATNVQKCVYNTVYDMKNRKAFPYSLLMKKDGTVEYEFNGVKTTISDAKDIYQNGYLRKDGTYVEIKIDGTWKKVSSNVEKMVGSYFVKKDNKTYTVNNQLICDFPIVQANYNSIIDEAGNLWSILFNDNKVELVKKDTNVVEFVNNRFYKDKQGNYKDIDNGEIVNNIYESNLKLNKDGKLYLNDKMILTNVTSMKLYYNDSASYEAYERYMILREDASIWCLYLDGEGKLVKMQETETSFIKKENNELALKEKVVRDSKTGEVINTISGFNMKNLSVEKAFSGKLSNGYTAKAYKGNTELKSTDKIYTGATIKIYNSKGEVVGTYTALVYGDITGTGTPSAKDALAIIKNNIGDGKELSSLQLEAARVTPETRAKGGVPTSADALAIVKAKLEKYTIE